MQPRQETQPGQRWKRGSATSIAPNDTETRSRWDRRFGKPFRPAGSTASDLFITTKLWNNNHRPERVQPAIESSRDRLELDYIDLYLMHTPYAFQPGDDQDPRDQNGHVIYDEGITLMDTWRAMENLVDRGNMQGDRLVGRKPRPAAGGLRAGENQTRRGPGRIPSLSAANRDPGLLQQQRTRDARLCAAGSWDQAGGAGRSGYPRDCAASQPDSRPSITRVGDTAWDSCSDDAEDSRSRQGEFRHLRLPADAMEEIDAIETRQRFNLVTGTGIPGFIAKGS